MILVDDFSLDLMTGDRDIMAKTMPNLARMMQDGATFCHYFATDSLCCPACSSIFTGMPQHKPGSSPTARRTAASGLHGHGHGDATKTFAWPRAIPLIPRE